MLDSTSTFGEVLDLPAGRSVLDKHLPGISASPMAVQHRDIPLGQLVGLVPVMTDPFARDRFWAALASVAHGVELRKYLPAVQPDDQYEADDVPRGSAHLSSPSSVRQWDVLEVRLQGPSHGNPFVDVDLEGVFDRDGEQLRVGGFYDGDGTYVLRALADRGGHWSLTTRSTARSLDGITAQIEVTAPAEVAHGPVRVDGFHFRHADGTRHRPLGTTAYVWTHQSEQLQDQTLETLRKGPFSKLRMCVFPKSYLFNADEPADFPFVGSLEDGFDFSRFNPTHFRRLEKRIAQLGELAIQADLILFHAYDRWGFADMGPAVDERYVRYLVRRLASFDNVWWSMANEYDLLWAKQESDWERLAAVVGDEDPFGHLTSIHNCIDFYDHSRPWITHVSAQRVDVYRTAEDTDAWRERWGKPVVIDECAYEGDIDQGWGSITGQELVRRFWEGAVRGGYVGHGETYLSDDEVLWWSKGGTLKGTSPERIAFLDQILGEAPNGVIDPVPSDWDAPWGGGSDLRIGYLGFNQPRYRDVFLREGEWAIDVIDTWAMTVEPFEGSCRGLVRVPLPGRQFMAIRCVRTG